MNKTCFIIFFLLTFFSFNLKAEEATWEGFSNTGLLILPKSIATFCALTEESVKRKADVVSCIYKILRFKADENAQSSLDAEKITQRALAERADAEQAKGVATKVYYSEWPDAVLPEIEKAHKTGDNSNKDKLNAIWELEKESALIQNVMLTIKAAELELNTMAEINNYKEQYND